MLNCRDVLSFSSAYSKKRLEKAFAVLGKAIVKRIIGFALFLLGANRKDIAQYLEVPFGTFLSFLSRVEKHGFLGFEDRRKTSSVPAPRSESVFNLSVRTNKQSINIELNRERNSISIPVNNTLQTKAVLLTLMSNGLISAKQTSAVLGLSERHTRELNNRLQQRDVHGLIDKRKGQMKDYRFIPEIKAEVVQQFAAHAITGRSTSSRVITEQINQRCDLDLADRSIRLHVQKLGLSRIVKSLPELIEALKKTPSTTSEQQQ
jgi:hypothetical protein